MKTSTTNENNPLLNWQERPAYDQITPDHVVPAIDALIAESEQAIHDIEQDPPVTWQGLFPRLEQIEDKLTRTWSLVGHLNGVRNSPELREAYTQVQPKLVAFANRMGQSAEIYQSLEAIQKNEGSTLNTVQTRILNSALRDAQMSGVGLEGEQKARYNEIAARMAELNTNFSNNVLDAVKAYTKVLTTAEETAGLPDSFLAMAADTARSKGHEEATAENGPWIITLDYPSYGPAMKYSSVRALRQELNNAYMTRASEGELNNAPIVAEILKLRQEQAKLLGFDNYAQVSMNRKMATVEGVEKLLNDLRDASQGAGASDIEQLKSLAQSMGAPEGDDFQSWDYSYWAEKLREKEYALNDEELRPYFPLPRVLEGMYDLVNRIFGITVKAADGQVPVWHPDVQYFNVFAEDGAHIADFYLDPYSRPSEKRGGAWADILIQRSKQFATEGNSVRKPAGYMCCNQTPPVDGKPSLMTFNEVLTMYHEFGHQLQNVLTTVDEGLASGLKNIEWDAIELASQFMENWCYHRPTLQGMAHHYETGEVLPDDLIDKIIASRTYQSGYATLRQLNFGLFDMTIHQITEPNAETALQLEKQVSAETSPLPVSDSNRFYCGFSHIFAGGYAAGYYSYKWAEVLSADAFAAFKEAGLDNDAEVKKLGRRFRDTVLARGGSEHPMDVFVAFRGREPQAEALLRQEGLI